MATRDDYIAVFDSGVGGISVLRQLVRTMPRERYFYFGDSANAPYGPRPVDEIRDLTLAAAEKLMDRGVKALVVACNTATAAAIVALREKYPDTIVIGIEPALKLAADHFPGGRIGVMATQATLRQEKFDALLHRFEDVCEVTELPAPGLVELVEAGKGNSAEAEALLRPILEPHAHLLDAVVLGCTHYPFARDVIGRILGPEVALLEGGPGTARETFRRLAEAELLRDGPGEVVMENSLSGSGMCELCRKLLYES
ncbi:MAG: glutamate racemase [Oscillospiraceae bacterium]|nr:glutamate racemase [Oscillospiraceae bacterium]